MQWKGETARSQPMLVIVQFFSLLWPMGARIIQPLRSNSFTPGAAHNWPNAYNRYSFEPIKVYLGLGSSIAVTIDQAVFL
jgi:hypothetical protein